MFVYRMTSGIDNSVVIFLCINWTPQLMIIEVMAEAT